MSATGDPERGSKGADRGDAGATLLEMLVVVALLAMSAAIAFPMAAGAYERLTAIVARSAVAADLRAARSAALRTDDPVAMQVFDDGRRYRVGDRDVLLPANVRLTAAPSRITFFPTGAAEPAHLQIASRGGVSLALEVEAGSGLVRLRP